MKIIILVLITAAILIGEDRTRQATRLPASIPSGATQVDANLYRYIDAKGKVWMYRQTPFGVSKWEEKADPQPVIEDKNPTRVKDLGESFQFERNTPFGVSKWIRKKSDLTKDEKALVEQQRTAELLEKQ